MNLPTLQPCPRCGVPQCEYEAEGFHTCEQCGHDFELRDIRQAVLVKLWGPGVEIVFFRARVWECERYTSRYSLPTGERWEIRVEGGGVK